MAHRMSARLELDRLAPSRRPAGHRPSGWQRWRELLFVHYTFPLEHVRRLVPAELELDPWDDVAWLGVVPFRMQGIRPRFVPFGIDFLELNVRTYVHYRGEPGIYFLSLEASSWLAVQAARHGWGLPYFHASMSSDRTGNRIDYHSRRHAGDAVAHYDFTFEEGAAPATAGTLDHFLLERYYLFTVDGGRVHKGHVHHTPYPVSAAALHTHSDSLLLAAGLPASGAPATLHYSAGVDVEVYGPFPIQPDILPRTR